MPETETTRAEKASKPRQVTLAVNDFPIDAFDPSIDGVDVITAEGTAVPADQEDAIREAARAAGVSLKKVSR